MSTYYGKLRSNRIQGMNKEKLENILGWFPGLSYEEDEDGLVILGNDINGLMDEDGEAMKYETVFDAEAEFRELIPDGQCLVLYEVGTEKYKYFEANALVITKTSSEYLRFPTIIEETAKQLLGNADYNLRLDY